MCFVSPRFSHFKLLAKDDFAMRWEDSRRSDNIEDRRGMPGGTVMIGGFGTLVIVLLALWLGVDPTPLLQQQQQAANQAAPGQVDVEGQDEARQFVAAVLADTEDVWRDLFKRMGCEYEDPKLVLFSGEVQSACGFAQSAMGPFYCPLDRKVYLDLSFFDELRTRFGASGNFAQAYVVAHEIGHHVQNQLGTMRKVEVLKQRLGERANNELSVRLELQADFLAGVWAHHAELHAPHPRSRRHRERAVPRRRLATTVCKCSRAATSFPIHSRTARPNNASAGFVAGSIPATSTPAIHSTPRTCDPRRRPRLALRGAAVSNHCNDRAESHGANHFPAESISIENHVDVFARRQLE